MLRRSEGEVYTISGAREGLSEDIRGRQRRYAISMGIRTVSVILAVVLWHVQTVIAAIALVVGAGLPYIAVVAANAGRSNNTTPPPAFVPGATRHLLEPGPAVPPVDTAAAGDESHPNGSN